MSLKKRNKTLQINLLVIVFTISTYSIHSQNEFDNYGPYGSKVYTDIKEALENTQNVYKLDLSYKPIEPKYYEKLPKLKQLQALKLSGNNVSSFPENFPQLTNLVYFASYNNAFTTFPSGLKEFGGLMYLEFFGSKIDSIPYDIAYLSRLKTFKFSSSNDTLNLPTTLKYLKNLHHFQLENCILDSFPKQVFKLPSVKYLNLTNTNTYFITTHFERLSNLEVLVLDQNHLKELPRTIYKAPKLRLLSLKNNNLTKLPDTICLLENLSLLDLRGNPISAEELQIIKALLPGCEVKF